MAMCMDISMDMRVGMCTDMCMDMYIDMSIHMCIDMCVDVRIDMCILRWTYYFLAARRRFVARLGPNYSGVG